MLLLYLETVKIAMIKFLKKKSKKVLAFFANLWYDKYR